MKTIRVSSSLDPHQTLHVSLDLGPNYFERNKINLCKKIPQEYHLSVLDADQAEHNVWPELGPNYLQKKK